MIEFRLQALSNIWTASANPRGQNRLQETGLLGSLRW